MTVYSKKLIIFDLDGTLAPSKSSIEPDMIELLLKLLQNKKVAIISGGGYPQFEEQLIRKIPVDSANLSNLMLLPTSGTRLYAWRGGWNEQYAEHLSPKEKEKIMDAFRLALKQNGYTQPEKTYGQIIEDRGSQITFSGLGQKAPLEEKNKWDPTREKRQKIVDVLQSKIPEFDARIGGTTSIDITKKGVNKSYGIRKLEEYLKIPLEEMIFIGDALYQGGNDFPAKATGVDCIQVDGPEETKKLIKSWLES